MLVKYIAAERSVPGTGSENHILWFREKRRKRKEKASYGQIKIYPLERTAIRLNNMFSNIAEENWQIQHTATITTKIRIPIQIYNKTKHRICIPTHILGY